MGESCVLIESATRESMTDGAKQQYRPTVQCHFQEKTNSFLVQMFALYSTKSMMCRFMMFSTQEVMQLCSSDNNLKGTKVFLEDNGVCMVNCMVSLKDDPGFRIQLLSPVELSFSYSYAYVFLRYE